MAYLESTSGANFSTNQAITQTVDSTNIFDITGAGVGNSPVMIGANGVNTAIGTDIGAADGVAVPQVLISFSKGTTVTGSLSISLKAAPDSGTYTEGTYYTLITTQALTGATQIAAAKQFYIPVPPIPPGFALPRFYKLTYTVTTGTISATVSASLLLNAPTVADVTLYGSNFPSGL